MDESCVLLVNLHQLLVSFVPHAGLWVCSHCNEVGYTLHRRHHQDLYYDYVLDSLYTCFLCRFSKGGCYHLLEVNVPVQDG